MEAFTRIYEHIDILRSFEMKEDKLSEYAKARQRLIELEKQAELGGGQERIEKQHAGGKYTARERLELLLDPGTFVELDKLKTHRCSDFGMADKKIPGDGVVTGYGKIENRLVFVFAQDFTVFGGSLSGAFAEKVCKVMDLASRNGAPVIGLNDSGGARIQEGVVSLSGYAEIFLRNTLFSGVIPQISMIMGPCAGGAVYSPAITDFVVMIEKTSHMFITGPDVIRAVNHEEVTKEELGGAMAHATRSGVANLTAKDETQGILMVRELLSYLPSNNMEDPPYHPTNDPIDRREEALKTIVPVNPNKPYDIKDIIHLVVDDKHFFEIHKDYAPNIVVGFARMGGYPVGILANQPAHLAGCLDIGSSKKGARFVRFCDAFNIPIVTFVDVPGFLPGVGQEHGGIIMEGAKLLFAYCESTVPRITIITRKGYGGAFVVMSCKHIRGDINLAYPTAEIAVMGPEGAVNIIHRSEITDAPNPEERRQELIGEFRELFANPYKSAELGHIDGVILPEETREHIIRSLEILKNKRQSNPPKKHGNIPL
jgi:propionyl-CoA carboxylase beta chain